MRSHTPSFWLWDDPEACRRRFELVHGLEDKRERSVHTAHLLHVLRDRQKRCLVKTHSSIVCWAVTGCDGGSSTVCAKGVTQPKALPCAGICFLRPQASHSSTAPS